MGFFDVEAIKLIIVFFVPGFISIKVYDLLVPTEKRDFSKSVLEVISYSCINFALLFWILILINQESFYAQYKFWYFGLTFLVIFISPITWPIILKNLLSSKFLKGKIIHPTPKAWDHFFSVGKSFWVLVHLKNGDLIGGLYGENSFASSFPNEQDLYLEEVWRVDKNGQFIERIHQTGGLLIKDQQIEFLEFFEIQN
jgi:hypothetical protein